MIVTGSISLVPSGIPPTIIPITAEPTTVITDDEEFTSSRTGKKFAFLYKVAAISMLSLLVRLKILNGIITLATSLLVKLLDESCMLKFKVLSKLGCNHASLCFNAAIYLLKVKPDIVSPVKLDLSNFKINIIIIIVHIVTNVHFLL